MERPGLEQLVLGVESCRRPLPKSRSQLADAGPVDDHLERRAGFFFTVSAVFMPFTASGPNTTKMPFGANASATDDSSPNTF